MAISFPSSPNDGDLYSAVGRTWQYDAAAGAWKSLSESNVTLTSLGISNLDTLSIDSAGEFGQSLIPDTNITYDLGSTTNRWRDLYLSGNSIQLGTRSITQDNIPDVDLAIAPEILEIQVSAPQAGQDTQWLWTWEQSTLPYARRTITNSPEVSVPLYKQGTYTVNNYAAYDLFDQMTQTHSLYLKWIDGAGTENTVSWATSGGPFSDSHPDINGGSATDVQRISVSVPATVTPPTLTPPNVSYTVVNNGAGAYTFSGAAKGDNPNLGPFYRGGTYTIDITATGHPFYFTTDNGTNFASGTYFGEYTDGVTGSRTDSGTITFTVPQDAPDTLYYQCGNHGPMRGAITIKNLAVEVNNNGNYVLYFQHTQEGHKTPVEIRPIPSLVNQMCLVYDASSGKFVPQDLATYVENTPSFENKIREVAGTAELVVEDGSTVVAKVNVYDDSTYLPLVGNNPGDQAFATDTNVLYIWDGSAWQQAGTTNSDDLIEGPDNLFYTNARVSTYLSDNGYDTATNIVASITDSAPATLDTLNELAAALGDDPNFATTTANNIATKLSLSGGAMTGPITTTSTIDGRDIATDGAKLDGIEAGADVTDTTNVTAAGALMDSEVTNLAQVKAFDSSDYATAAQGTLADNALPLSGGNITGNLDVAGTINAQSAFTTDQVRHSIRPTLNLDFANSKQLDPRITFYRDSIATYYDSKGVLRYANSNEPRFDHDPVTGESKGLLVEESRTNIVVNPDINSLGKTGAIVQPNAELAPDGKYSAYKISEDTSPNFHFVSVSASQPAGPISFSCFLKSGGTNIASLFLTQGGNSTAQFNLTTGTVISVSGTGNTAEIKEVGNGWYYCTIKNDAVAANTASGYRVGPNNGAGSGYNGDINDYIYAWGLQVEANSFPTSYIPSDTRFTSRSSAATYHDENGILRTAPANSPRYGYKYDGRKWVETGLILEQESTNLVLNSAMSSSSNWSPSATTIIMGDYGLNPDNSQGNTMFVRTNQAGGGKHIRQSFSIQQAQDYTISVYAKLPSGGTNAYDFLYLRLYDATNTTSFQAWFNIDTGTIGTVQNAHYAKIEYVGNGWYRCSVSGKTTSSSNIGTMLYDLFVAETDGVEPNPGDNSSGLLMWGAQLESGFNTTSFVYTNSGAVTRSADVASSTSYTRENETAVIDGNTFEQIFYSGKTSIPEGTVYSEYDLTGYVAGNYQCVWGITNGTSNERIWQYAIGGAPNPQFIGSTSGTTEFALSEGTTHTTNDLYKTAATYGLNNYEFAINGTSAGTDTTGTPSTKLDRFTIGTNYQDNYVMSGHIKKLSYYNQQLSSTELTALTENN